MSLYIKFGKIYFFSLVITLYIINLLLSLILSTYFYNKVLKTSICYGDGAADLKNTFYCNVIPAKNFPKSILHH